MTVFKEELRNNKLSLIIWSLAIAFLMAITIILYPEMKSQMEEMNNMFADMGAFTAAFGMDQLNFGSLLGYYAIESGNMMAMGGGLFAAILGITSLMKEEKERTAEYLLTQPISRSRVVTEKLLSIIFLLIVFNIIVISITLLSFLIIGEEVPWNEFVLLHISYFLLQLVIAYICFGISAFLSRGGLGIGIGLTAMFYFLNLISNITEEAKMLKYITPYSFAEGAPIINDLELQFKYLIPGIVMMFIGIIIAYVIYPRKDIKI